MNRLLYILVFFLLTGNGLYAQKSVVKLASPNGRLKVTIYTTPDLSYSVQYDTTTILNKSHIALQINDGYTLGKNHRLVQHLPTGISRLVEPTIPTKYARKRNTYRGMVFTFRATDLRDYKVEFRVFNDAVAYRFVPDFGNIILVKDETVQLNFPQNTICYFPEEKSFMSHYEPLYNLISLDTKPEDKLGSLPLLIKTNGFNVLFTEVNVYDYPNMFIKIHNKDSLYGVFPRIVKETRPDPKHPDRNEIIVKNKPQMAITYGRREMPWRTLLISKNDGGLIASNTLVSLANDNKYPKQTSWIKPGKAVWDWYSANDIYKKNTGKKISTETYKYYIDFAAKYGIEYVLMDEGWSKSTTQITEAKKDIDIKTIVAYGKERNVGIILWVLWKPLEEDLECTLETYKKWGIKGIKVDFMQRADQGMVKFFQRVAEEAFKDSLIVDFHGSYKPSGMNITYPNVLSFEGVKGNENNKWSNIITPEHTLKIPFIRMVAGPMDFTPGAVANAQPNRFKVSWSEPMSLGTRTRQAAMYVAYESGLQMLCDAPQRYEQIPDFTRFIANIPTTWDETVVLDAKIGERLIIARRKGKKWYLAGLNSSAPREISVNLSRFLPVGLYQATILEDGRAADFEAEDYTIHSSKFTETKKLKIYMASGGGFVVVLEPIEKKRLSKKQRKKKKDEV